MASKTAQKDPAQLTAQVMGPKGCTNLKLRQLTRLVTQHCEPHFSESGLKTTQYALLSHVDKLGPIAPGELARKMDLDASTLTRNLQPLLTGGWIEVLPGEDGRSRIVQVTTAGRAKRAEMKADWKRAQMSVNATLGDERVQRLHALLDECLELLRY
jgi:DNA-binding MarR family transcriptional regulator